MVLVNRKTSALLKLVGAAVVLASAVVDRYVYQSAKDRMAELTEVIGDQALIDKGALINQTSMYLLSDPNVDVDGRQYLQAHHAHSVAIKEVQSVVGLISHIDRVSSVQKAEDSAVIRAAADKVVDVKTLSDFFVLFNAVTDKYAVGLGPQLARIRGWLSLGNIAFSCLYAIGGGLVLFAAYIDWRLSAQEEVATTVGVPKPRVTGKKRHVA